MVLEPPVKVFYTKFGMPYPLMIDLSIPWKFSLQNLTVISYQSAKVFSLESFPPYGTVHTLYCTYIRKLYWDYNIMYINISIIVCERVCIRVWKCVLSASMYICTSKVSMCVCVCVCVCTLHVYTAIPQKVNVSMAQRETVRDLPQRDCTHTNAHYRHKHLSQTCKHL